REIGNDRMNGKVGEIAPQLRRILLQEISGNVDRDIGLDRRRGAEQNARLPARPPAARPGKRRPSRAEPLPNSISAQPDGKNEAMAGAYWCSSASSQRVGEYSGGGGALSNNTAH